MDDPVHIVGRGVDLGAIIDAERLPALGQAGPGQYMTLTPGEKVKVTDGCPPVGGHGIVVGGGGLVMYSGARQVRCRIPSSGTGDARLSLVTRLVAVFVHKRAVGHVDRGYRFLFALGGVSVIGSIDTSDSWPLRQDCIEELCSAAGIGYGLEEFDDVGAFLAAHPSWADPRLEFEVDHPDEEAVREVGMFIWLAGGLVALLGGAYVAAFMATGVGLWYRGLLWAGLAAMTALTVWSKSRRRMRRSLAKAGSGRK